MKVIQKQLLPSSGHLDLCRLDTSTIFSMDPALSTVFSYEQVLFKKRSPTKLFMAFSFIVVTILLLLSLIILR